ncbi:hypothetical protein LTR91_020513, partial [Friedmanniomyces endolithicus]
AASLGIYENGERAGLSDQAATTRINVIWRIDERTWQESYTSRKPSTKRIAGCKHRPTVA